MLKLVAVNIKCLTNCTVIKIRQALKFSLNYNSFFAFFFLVNVPEIHVAEFYGVQLELNGKDQSGDNKYPMRQKIVIKREGEIEKRKKKGGMLEENEKK